MKSWITAFEQAKASGLAAKGGGSVVAAAPEKSKSQSLIVSRLSSKKEEEDIDYISSDEEYEHKKVTPGKKTYVEQPYTTQIESIKK